jgi:hypothetical protein
MTVVPSASARLSRGTSPTASSDTARIPAARVLAGGERQARRATVTPAEAMTATSQVGSALTPFMMLRMGGSVGGALRRDARRPALRRVE